MFKEFLACVKANANKIDGVLFYKISRSSRNLPDYVQLETLEADHNIEFISATEPTQNTPAGRMFRRQLAVMADFFTEQQSVDVREGHACTFWARSVTPSSLPKTRRSGIALPNTP